MMRIIFFLCLLCHLETEVKLEFLCLRLWAWTIWDHNYDEDGHLPSLYLVFRLRNFLLKQFTWRFLVFYYSFRFFICTVYLSLLFFFQLSCTVRLDSGVYVKDMFCCLSSFYIGECYLSQLLFPTSLDCDVLKVSVQKFVSYSNGFCWVKQLSEGKTWCLVLENYYKPWK